MQDALGGRTQALPQGKALGGSSAFNGLAFNPPSKAHMDAWAGLGNEGWGWDSFSKSLIKAYTVGDASGGPLQVSFPVDEDSEWSKAWHETLGSLGYTKNGNIFADELAGAAAVPDTIIGASRTRSYAANAFLLPADGAQSNLTVQTEVLVNKVLFTNDGSVTATGVLYTDAAGQQHTVRSRKEIILSAGAIQSPKILELSGVGDAKRLSSLGIDVVLDNPNVGENLQNHPMVNITFESQGDLPTMDALARQDPDAINAAMTEYGGKKAGPFSRSGTNTVALLPLAGKVADGQDVEVAPEANESAFSKKQADFVQSVLRSPDQASALYLMAPAYVAFNADGTGAPPRPGAETFLSIIVILSHPLSKGSTHITSADTASSPAIDPKLLSHPIDKIVLAKHLLFASKTLRQAEPLSSKLATSGQRYPETPLDDLTSAEKYLEQHAMGAHHVAGSCAMLPESLGGVVDASLRVHGIKGLRVCDASVIPILPRGNPQATVYGVAEHGANIIRASS